MSKVILVATEKPFAKAAVDRIKQVVAKNPDFGLRLLENYTDKQWENIGDWVDDCSTPEFNYSLIY